MLQFKPIDGEIGNEEDVAEGLANPASRRLFWLANEYNKGEAGRSFQPVPEAEGQAQTQSQTQNQNTPVRNSETFQPNPNINEIAASAPANISFEQGTSSADGMDFDAPVREELTGSRLAKDQYENAPPAARERDMWKRLGSGLWNALRMWGESGGQGGLGGLIGMAGTAGIGSAVSPEAHQRLKTNIQKNDALNRYTQMLGVESLEDKRRQEGLKTYYDAYRTQNEAMKPALEAEEAVRKRQDAARNNLAKLDRYDPKDPVHRDWAIQGGYNPDTYSKRDLLVDFSLSDGRTVQIKGSDAAAADAMRASKQFEYETEVERQNRIAQEKYQSEQRSYENALRERDSKVSSLTAEGNAKMTQARQLYLQSEALDRQADAIGEADPERAGKLRDDAVKLRNEATRTGSEGKAILENAKNLPKPVQPTAPTPIQARQMPTPGQSPPPPKSLLEAELQRQGIKKGSTDWIKVMNAAGYQ